MKLILAVLVGLLVAPIVAAQTTVSNLTDEEVGALLESNVAPIKTIGALRFCGAKGIERSLVMNMMRPISSSLIKQDLAHSKANISHVLAAIDIQSIGVATGLVLAQMTEAKKGQFCQAATEAADKLLSVGAHSSGS